MSRICSKAPHETHCGIWTLRRARFPGARFFTVLGALFIAAVSFAAGAATDSGELDPAKVERGRYVTSISGCNDCHTSGFAASEGQVPESRWLSGDSLGWRGPWGTTYPSNLRRLLASLSEDQWVHLARNLKSRPPMPWFNLRYMSDDDLRSIHQFVRFLGTTEESVPEYVPPEREPATPYVSFPSPAQ